MCGTTAGTATAASLTCACSGCGKRSGPNGSRRSVASATSCGLDVQTLRALLNWRSLRWKITLLVAVAGGAIALTVCLLVHRSTYEWSMNTDAAQAYSALRTALASDGGSAASQL